MITKLTLNKKLKGFMDKLTEHLAKEHDVKEGEVLALKLLAEQAFHDGIVQMANLYESLTMEAVREFEEEQLKN